MKVKKYDFDRIIDRRNTNSTKYDCVPWIEANAPNDCIPMWVADMDFAAPPEVLDAMRQRLDHGIIGYTNLVSGSYRSALDAWMLKRHGWDSSGQRLVLTYGVLHAILHMIELLSEPGDGVILQPPIYPPFLTQITTAGRTPVYNPLLCGTDHYYTMDYDDLEKKAQDPRTKVLLLCSPHNPTGRVWQEEELRRLAEICFANDVKIIVDEIHHDLTRQGVRAISLAALYPNDRRIITCTAPSKTFNLAGNVSANLLFADEELETKYYEKYMDPIPCLASIATEAAYTYGEPWLDELRQYLDDNFHFFRQKLTECMPSVSMNTPEGTYLAWVDFRGLGLSADEVKDRIVNKAGVIVEDGRSFLSGGEGYIRFNLACPRSIIAQAIDRITDEFTEGRK